MYLRAALACCHDLEEEVAHIYDELAALHSGDEGLAESWTALARDERLHARILTGLLAAQEVQEDDGPFLVDIPLRIASARQALDNAYRLVRSGIDAQRAVDLTEALERSELNDLFEEVVRLAQPALNRLLSTLERRLGVTHIHRRHLAALRKRGSRAVAATRASASNKEIPRRREGSPRQQQQQAAAPNRG